MPTAKAKKAAASARSSAGARRIHKSHLQDFIVLGVMNLQSKWSLYSIAEGFGHIALRWSPAIAIISRFPRHSRESR